MKSLGDVYEMVEKQLKELDKPVYRPPRVNRVNRGKRKTGGLNWEETPEINLMKKKRISRGSKNRIPKRKRKGKKK